MSDRRNIGLLWKSFHCSSAVGVCSIDRKLLAPRYQALSGY